MKASEHLLKALAVAIELTGTDLTKAAARVMAEDLAQYPEAAVITALARCRRELRGKLALADVLDRLPGNHPGAEEAWSICAGCLNDERLTVVWTQEMALSFGVALGLQADHVAARMAFKETYTANVALARLDARMPVWSVSPGTDKDGRELAILDAVEKGRITVNYARRVLPYHRGDEGLSARLLALADKSVKAPLLEDKTA